MPPEGGGNNNNVAGAGTTAAASATTAVTPTAGDYGVNNNTAGSMIPEGGVDAGVDLSAPGYAGGADEAEARMLRVWLNANVATTAIQVCESENSRLFV